MEQKKRNSQELNENLDMMNGGVERCEECGQPLTHNDKQEFGNHCEACAVSRKEAEVAEQNADISIVENAKGLKGVRVQALGEDYVICPKDLDGGKDNFSYDSAKKRLKELGLDTFNRKQGFIIAIYIEEINAKLGEVGGDKFARDVYVSNELWHPVGSSAYYLGDYTWYFSGDYGVLFSNDRYYGNFRCRPVLAYSAFQN